MSPPVGGAGSQQVWTAGWSTSQSWSDRPLWSGLRFTRARLNDFPLTGNLVRVSASHLELEPVDDVLDVGAGQRLSEAQLFGKVDLVVEFVQLLQKLLLRHRTVQDGAATTQV